MNDAGNHHVATETDDTAAPPLSLSERVRSLRLPERSATHGRRGVAWVPWTLCVLLAGAAGYAGFVRLDGDKEYHDYLELKKTVSNPTEALVNQAKAQENQPKTDPKLGPIALESKGYIIPISLIQVSPKVGGMVMKLFITEGMAVKKDLLLAELEDIDYKADYDRAVATVVGTQRRCDELWKYRELEIKQAVADWEDSKAQRVQMLLDFNRSVTLKNANSLAITPKEFEQAESAYRSMDYRTERLKLAYDLLKGPGPRDEKIAAAKADWEQAKADLAKAEWRLSNCKVRAPIEGIILTKKAEEGNQVNPSAFSNGLSASLCEMADLTKMEVDLAIPERDIGKVFDKQACQVRAEAFPERNYVGWVTRRMPTGDRSKGAVPVRVKIVIPREEAGEYLRPEMGAIVTFFNKKYEPQ